MAARTLGGRIFRGRRLRGAAHILALPGNALYPAVIPREQFVARVSWLQFEIPSAAAAGGSTIKYWNGSAWTAKPLKRWDGSQWVSATLKRWNGSGWA